VLENKRKYTVREAVVESFKEHKEIIRNARKGKRDSHGFSAEHVLEWYEVGGSRGFILELAKKKIEELTLREIDDVMHLNHQITNCRNPCKTCGQVLKLDDEFWFVPFSYCEEYPCGIQLCWNCLKELIKID